MGWILVGLLMCGSICLAEPTRTRSLEDALFEDARPDRLPRATLQDVDPRPQGDSSHFAPSRLTRRSFWAEELRLSSVSDDVLPLLSVAQRMRDVQGMLDQAECGAKTQHAQREILDSLDRLLEQAGQCHGPGRTCSGKTTKEDQTPKPNASCNQSNNQQKPNAQQGTSPDKSGNAGDGTARQPGGVSPSMDAARRRAILKRLWGELPARQRDEMLQMPVEEFLPRYELLIEEYFRSLSKKKNKR